MSLLIISNLNCSIFIFIFFPELAFLLSCSDLDFFFVRLTLSKKKLNDNDYKERS